MIEVRNRMQAEAFTTLDGSTIRVLLDAQLGGASEQSLAEATLAAGTAPGGRVFERAGRPALGRGVTITREPRRST